MDLDDYIRRLMYVKDDMNHENILQIEKALHLYSF